jgi:hypothetical protein
MDIGMAAEVGAVLDISADNGVGAGLSISFGLTARLSWRQFSPNMVLMTPAEHIDQLIAGLKDWRGKTLASVRKCMAEADREMVEDWKWMGSPTWYCDGLIAVANAHKGKVKLTFAYGAHVADPGKLFNAGLDGNARRAIDFFEGDKVDAVALKRLVQAAIAYNRNKPKAKKKAPGRQTV